MNAVRLTRDQRGFTLAELLVAIAIVGFVMAGILILLMSGNQTYLTGSNQVEAQAALRASVERMATDIREAGYDPRGLGACIPPPPANCFDAIINANANSFTIQSDWDGGSVAPALPPIQAGVAVNVSYNFGGAPTNVLRGEQITYSIAAGTLTRQEAVVDAQPMPVLVNVLQASEGGALQPFFQYLDVDDNLIANPGANASQIRTIVLRLRAGVQQNPGPAIFQAGAVQVTMSDRIRLRNR